MGVASSIERRSADAAGGCVVAKPDGGDALTVGARRRHNAHGPERAGVRKAPLPALALGFHGIRPGGIVSDATAGGERRPQAVCLLGLEVE